MIVVEGSAVQPVVMDPKDDVIVGKTPVSACRVLNMNDADGWGAAVTTFGIGGRLNWHTHDSEQILFVTAGRGIVATADEERVITAGCIVYIPAGENHWHGASDDSSMTHLNIQKAGIHLSEQG